MPNITVYNLTAAQLVLPSGYCTVTLPAGGSNTFAVPDVDEFRGITTISDLVDAGYISIEASTDSASVRPVPTYTTTELGTTVPATLFPSGTIVYDETRMSPVAAVTDIWRNHTTVVAGDTVALGLLTNVPTNAVAFDTTLATLVRYNGTAWVTCHLSTAISAQPGVPGAGVAGDLTYDTTAQALMICTNAVGPVWDTVFTAAVGTTVAPPVEATTATGSAYYNTTTRRLSLRVGAAWVHLPVVHYATAAAIAAVPDAAAHVGEFGWASDTNRLAVCVTDATPGPAVWFNETTVTIDAPGAGHAYNGAVIFDGTGFINTMAARGQLRVYSQAAAVWRQAQKVLPVVNLVGDLPAVADVPVGYMVLVRAGVGIPGTTLYTKIGAAWVTGL
jgi:hypothetical protein